jgi:hypothetical protein
MTEQERLQCNSIDTNALNSCDRNRVEEVGFESMARRGHNTELGWHSSLATATAPEEMRGV